MAIQMNLLAMRIAYGQTRLRQAVELQSAAIQYQLHDQEILGTPFRYTVSATGPGLDRAQQQLRLIDAERVIGDELIGFWFCKHRYSADFLYRALLSDDKISCWLMYSTDGSE